MDAKTTPSAFFQFPFGDFTMTVIQDGSFPTDISRFGGSQTEAEVAAFFQKHNLPTHFYNTLNILMIQAADRIALIDTGLGVSGGGGRLLSTLALLGIRLEAVTDVVISHFHGDHVGGISQDGIAIFPNATHHIAQTEWDFLQNVAAGSPFEQGANNAKAKLQPVLAADQLRYYSDGEEIMPGVQALATPGHSPGHHAILLTSGDKRLLHIVDALNHSIANVQNPHWQFRFDADGELAVKTRLELLNRAADETLSVMGYHFAFPGIGYIERDGDSDSNRFRFQALH